MSKSHEFRVDESGELDEVFLKNATVHIERMDDTAFWIGIDVEGKPRLMLNTGVHQGRWFFNLEEDSLDGKTFQIERPRRKRAGDSAEAKA